MDDEQRHAYLKAANVSAMVVRAEDFTMSFRESADVADDLVLDIPTNIIREFGGRPADRVNQSGPPPGKFIVNISLGALREQLQRASAA